MVRVYPRNPGISFTPEGTEPATNSAVEFLGPLFKVTRVNLRGGGDNIRATKISSSALGLLPTPPESCLNAEIKKYWKQRYELFSRYDDGILMDTEGWFSVTPEAIAKHHAARCGSGTIVDCFAGSGGNVIQFAKNSRRVIAVDIDPVKLQYAKHNAEIYGVQRRRVEYILGDCTVVAPTLKGDAVFLSPPWGGPEYSKEKVFDVRTMLKPIDGFDLFEMATKIAPKVVMFLPRNVDVNQLAEMAVSVSPPWSLEVEKNYLNGKFKAVTAYFSQPKW